MKSLFPTGWVLTFSLAACCVNATDFSTQVTIYRDLSGVPHIVGDTEQAAFFGFGYAQAQDHLERMMLEYRDAQGRRSEILGASAIIPDPLQYDRAAYRWGGDYSQRLLRTWQAVADHPGGIDPHVFTLLDAFAAGVNRYIDEHRATIPRWIEHIQAIDIEALERSYYFRFYSAGDGLAKLAGIAGSAPNLGSNQWAVAARKSASGHILHVEHVHMPWGNRLQLYEAHLLVPGQLDVAGMGWFGSPFFLAGFNREISWSITWNQPNLSDIYQEAFNPANALQYLYDGRWCDIRKETATFLFQNTAGRSASKTLPLHYTRHGPVVHFDKVHHFAYSLKVPNFAGVNYSTGLYGLMTARSISEFQAVLNRQLIPRWNFLCTSQANMYWVHNGIVSRRNPRYDWLKPVPGWTKDTEWNGYLPFSSNPHLSNPQSGFIQNANNPPWFSTTNSGINPLEPTKYYYGYPVSAGAGDEMLNLRGERLREVLSRPAPLTLGQMMSLGFDTYVLAADIAIPLLERAGVRHAADRDTSQAARLLAVWNRRSSVESAAFTYFYYWAEAYRARYSPADFARFNSYQRHSIALDSEREQEKAWAALREAVRHVRETFARSPVPWGDINRVVRGGSYPLAGTGGFDVLHPDEGHETSDGHILCDSGWGHLMVIEESQPKRVWSLLPFGESEDPRSPHYNDQAQLHSRQQLKRFWLTSEEIASHTESIWGDAARLRRDPQAH